MRVLVVDDHPMIVDAVGLVLSTLDARAEIIDADTVQKAIARVAGVEIDLALVDLALPGMRGAEAIASLRHACPDLPLVVLSGNDDPAIIFAALDAGAMGYIPKSTGRKGMLEALARVLRGDSYLPPGIVNRIDALADRPSVDWRDLGLTERQREVLELMIRGISNKGICKRLAISENTVKVHVSAIFRSLGVTNRTQAVIAAHRLGLASRSPH